MSWRGPLLQTVVAVVVVMVLELVVLMVVLELVVVAAMWVTRVAPVTVVMALLHAVAAFHGSSCTHLGRGLLSVTLGCRRRPRLAAATAAVVLSPRGSASGPHTTSRLPIDACCLSV